jgi:D-methionine transport system ATP-binding protein
MLQKKSYQAVNSVNLDINKGEIYGIIGESGAGKSTLLRLMNALESPDHGSVIVNGQDLTLLSEAKLREARRSIGVIFQHFNLLQNRTVLGNVTVPLELTGVPHKARRERALQCLNFVGLTEYVDQYPAQLSGGQKQRVAIASCSVMNPPPHLILRRLLKSWKC